MSETWRREPVDSPCVRICLMHPQAGLCIGCRRTLDEIGRWSGMTPAERRAVIADLPSRRLPAVRRGGRAGRTGGV